MKAGDKIKYEDDLVVVTEKGKEIYKGLEDYEPMRYEPWVWKFTTKSGKGHYELQNGRYKKYKVC